MRLWSRGRLGLRLGGRLAWRQPVHSLLTAVAVAVPVAVLSASGTLAATSADTPDKAAARQLGTADGKITPVRSPGADFPADRAEVEARVRAVLPAGARLARDDDATLVVGSVSGLRTKVERGRVLDLADPLTHGIYRVDGGAANAPGTVSLTRKLADRLRVRAGDPVTVQALASDAERAGAGRQVPLRVAAILDPPEDDPGDAAVLAPASAGQVLGEGMTRLSPGWLVGADPGAARAALAGHGFGWHGRSDISFHPKSSGLASAGTVAGVGLGMVSVVLCWAALAVVWRSQRRTVALLAALGSPVRVQTGLLTTYAAVVSAAGAVAGAALGHLGSVWLVPWAQGPARDWGPVQHTWGRTAVTVVVTVAVAALLGRLAARNAVRAEPGRLLREQPSPRGAGRNAVALAVGLLAATAVLGWQAHRLGVSAAGAGPSKSRETLSAGLLLSAGLTGVAGCVLLWCAGLSRVVGKLPLTLRVAARAMLGSAGRLIAGMTIVAFLAMVATTLVTVMDSTADRDRGQPGNLPAGAALASLPRTLRPSERAELGQATQTSTATFAVAVGAGGSPALPATPYLRCLNATTGIHGTPSSACERQPGRQVRDDSYLVAIADPADAQMLTGVELGAAEQSAYRDGSLAIVRPEAATPDGGQVEIMAARNGSDERTLASLGVLRTIPAGAGDRAKLPPVVISPAAATALGLRDRPDSAHVLLLPNRPGAVLDEPAITEALPAELRLDATTTAHRADSRAEQERNDTRAIGAVVGAVATLIVAVLAALGSADQSGDHRLLAAIGASCRWRRGMAGLAQALLTLPAVLIGAGWGAITAALAWSGLLTQTAPMNYPSGAVATAAVAMSVAAITIGAAAVPRTRSPR